MTGPETVAAVGGIAVTGSVLMYLLARYALKVDRLGQVVLTGVIFFTTILSATLNWFLAGPAQ